MKDEKVLNEKVIELMKQERYKEALKLLEKHLQLQPTNLNALNQASIINYQLKHWEEALNYSKIILKIQPDNPDFHNRIGKLFLKLRNIEEAEKYLLKGHDIDNSLFSINYNLGLLYETKGELNKSKEFYTNALRKKIDSSRIYKKLANIYRRTGNAEKIEELISIARKNLTTVGFLYDYLLTLLYERNEYKKILDFYQEIYKYEPENVSNLVNISLFYERKGDLNNSFFWLNKAQKIKSKFSPLVFIKYAYHRLINGMWEDWATLEERLMSEVETYIQDPNINYRIPVFNLFHFKLPRELIFKACKKLSTIKKGNIKQFRHQEVNSKNTKKKLRIGYIIPKTYRQANTILYHGLFKYHNRKRFEIYVYSLFSHQDDITQIIKNGVDHFINCSKLSPDAIALTIKNDKIDIIVTTAAHANQMQLEILAYKPAPIIINGQGFNESPGADFIDYSIVDNEILTEESKIVYLENFLIFEGSSANNSALPISKSEINMVRNDVGLPEKKFVYACLCAPRKLHPDCFSSWAEIIKETDNSIIWFFDNNNIQLRNAIINMFKKYGVEKDRLHFSGNVSMEISWSRYKLANLFLDTFIYNSHAVAIEALRMGLPVLTLKGTTHVSRYGASILKAAGLDELICHNKLEYIRKAVQFYKNQTSLEKICKHLESSEVPLFKTKDYVAKLEKSFVLVWKNYIGGYPTRDLIIK